MGNIHAAATGGIITNVIFGILSLISIVSMVPGNAGKKSAKVHHQQQNLLQNN
jgi:DHA2 family multidrug resistance protein-like MFS transporter